MIIALTQGRRSESIPSNEICISEWLPFRDAIQVRRNGGRRYCMNFIPSKDHIPSFSDRVRTGRPILLRSGQVLVFWGVFDFVLKLVNRVLDLFGKGESLIDLYRTLPEVLKILENPIVGAAAIIFGFGALWHQGRTLGVNSRSAVVLFDPHHRPVSGPRTTPALKRALWTSMFAVALAAVIWTALETPVRDLLFLRKLTVQITPPSVANPRYHSETHRLALASPLNPNSPRALVRPPTVETRPEPAPMVSAQPISATTHQQTPQYPSAYQEVRAAILAVKPLMKLLGKADSLRPQGNAILEGDMFSPLSL